MLSTTILRSRGTQLVAATTITLLLALAALAVQASPAFAQDETLTVTKTGSGTVTSDPAGINCGNDCSEPYPSSEIPEICNQHGACEPPRTVYQGVTLTASPAPGWVFQGWSSNCSGTGATCTVTVNEANETVHATFIQRPPNDDFAAARLISGATTSVSGTTKDATREAGEPDHSSDTWSSDHTVWYRWTAPHTGEWTVDTCQANIDSILTVYTGSQLDALSRVAENNNHPDCPQDTFGSKLTFRATAGTTYRIVVGDAGGAMQNTFTLAFNAIPAPPNDNFDSAQLISGASASVNGTNVSATRESSDPWSGTGERSVWYKWTAHFSGSATLNTCTTNFDTLLSVSTSRFFGLVNSNNNHTDCPSGTFGSKLSFNAQRNQTYFIGVDGCCGAPQGTFTLALNLVDDVAPNTRITQGPNDGSATSNTSVTFAFDADEPGSTFKCRVYPAALTGPAFDNCSGAGTHTASGFSPGTYNFEVQATDAANNADQTPAKRTFTVDTGPPTLNITGGPNGGTYAPGSTQRWTFTASDAIDSTPSVQCKVEVNASPSAFGPCSGGSSSHSVSNLPAGSHKFYVRATDDAGNVTPEQTRSFSIVATPPPDTTAPTGTVRINGGRASTKKLMVTLNLSASDAGSGVPAMRISNRAGALASAGWQPFVGSKRWRLLGGKSKTKTVFVQYRDGAGNVSAVALDRIKYRK